MFYSLQNTITVVKCAIVASVSNIILNFALIGPLAHKGLALATSLSSLVLVILLSIALRGKSEQASIKASMVFMKIFAASLFMWFFIHIMKSIFFDYGF